MAKKKWRDLSPRTRAGIIAAGCVQLGMAIAAWTDLSRRPSAQVKGPKPLWAAIIPLNSLMPILYLAWGRRRAVPTD